MMALEKIEFDVLTVVERVADLMAPKAAEKHLELMTSVHPDIPSVSLAILPACSRFSSTWLAMQSNSPGWVRWWCRCRSSI